MGRAVRATYFRQQSASKCLKEGSREVNCLNAMLRVGHCGSMAAEDMDLWHLSKHYSLNFHER